MSGYVESDVPAGQAACFPYCGGGDAKLLGANAPARRIEKMSFISKVMSGNYLGVGCRRPTIVLEA